MKPFSIISIVLSFSLFFSCTDVREKFNEVNPNDPTEAPATMILPSLIAGVQLFHSGDAARIAGMWSGHFSGWDRPYLTYGSARSGPRSFDLPWRVFYNDNFNTALAVKEAADAPGQEEIFGVASICQAFSLGTATDLWGDIPYSTVDDPVTYPHPPYDSQIDVYQTVQSLLDEGITLASGTNDYSYSTSLGDWGEVAHTLKARNYLHTGDYEGALNATLNGISSPENDWISLHDSSSEESYNVFYAFSEARPSLLSAHKCHLVNLLDNVPDNPLYRGDDKTDEGARFDWYYVKQFEVYQSYADPNTIDGMFTADASFPLVSYVENQLIAAECQLRLGNSAAALEHLNNVRAVNDTYYGEGDQSTYAPYDLSDFNNDTELLTEILEEKYVSLFGQIESFSDMRRTDNLLGIEHFAGVLQAPLERFLYPESEIEWNPNIPDPQPDQYTPTPVNL